MSYPFLFIIILFYIKKRKKLTYLWFFFYSPERFEELRKEVGKKHKGVQIELRGRIYCYNCGEEGHKGEVKRLLF